MLSRLKYAIKQTCSPTSEWKSKIDFRIISNHRKTQLSPSGIDHQPSDSLYILTYYLD